MSATRVAAVHARTVYDSRGRPTVEAEVRLAGGATGRGIAPAGASRGRHEAVDLRHPASSTAVRAAVHAGRSLTGLVAPAVAAYIREHCLYKTGR